MQEIINKLADLFRQRNQIDDIIETTIGFMHVVEEEAKKEVPQPKKGGKRRGGGRKKKEGGKITRYRCEDCEDIFSSDKKYLDVACETCGSRKIIKMPE